MALRSVVLEAPAQPPAPRRTVVLRTGGPAPKGRVVDIIVGVIGVLLLIAAIALAQVLPDKTYVNPQFRVTFFEQVGEGPGTMTHEFANGDGPFEFKVDVPVDNVQSITLLMGFADDLPYSGPDQFSVELYGPDGTLHGTAIDVANPPPKAGRNSTDAPQTFIADEQSTIGIAEAKGEEIVTGLTHTETVEQVKARLEPQHRVLTKGTWTVRVTLVAAQGCPPPGEGYSSQAIDCRFGRPGGQAPASQDGSDAGNLFRLSNLSYTFYTVEVQELK